MIPLMVDELGLIDLPVKSKIDRVCEYFSFIENRSITILGNFSLTFGSLTSVSIIVELVK